MAATVLHDPYLIGNERWCSCCFPAGPPVGMRIGATWREKARRGCNECAGAGRIALSAEEIVAASVAEKRTVREAQA